jgi:predicted esterase
MRTLACVFAVCLILPSLARAQQDDVADVPSQDLRVAGNDQQRYFLIGAKDGQMPPEKGYGLLLILPGGDGSADFNPFIKRIWQNALPPGYLLAQLVAVPSNNQNQVVWPTAKSHDPKQMFTSEDFIAGVIKEVAAKRKIDDLKIFALGWSSGGPAVYAATLMKGSLIKGAFVAMSVFFPNQLPPLAGAKDKPIFLLQSPDDQVTRYFFAKNAENQLKVAGAKVKLMDYPGGHGWQGDVFGYIQSGIQWLEKGGEGEAKP